MNIRAKMKCSAVVVNGDNETVTLFPVYSDDPASENAQWSKWTPGGQLQLTISNPSAQGQFKVDAEYFVDCTPVVTTKDAGDAA